MDENKERSLVAKVMDGLVSGIVEQKYGAILPPQDVLSKEFDVSRTVMREALSMLLARHMLDVRPKTGTRIRPMSDWRLIDEDVVSWRFPAKMSDMSGCEHPRIPASATWLVPLSSSRNFRRCAGERRRTARPLRSD